MFLYRPVMRAGYRAAVEHVLFGVGVDLRQQNHLSIKQSILDCPGSEIRPSLLRSVYGYRSVYRPLAAWFIPSPLLPHSSSAQCRLRALFRGCRANSPQVQRYVGM